MAVRKDQVQIDISFITDENRQFAKLNQGSKQLIADLNKAKKEGGDLANVLNRVVKEGEGIENLDLRRVAPAELIARAKTLASTLAQIPDSAPGAAKLQAEYQRINSRLAEIRATTRGVVQESAKAKTALSGAFAVFGGLSLAGLASGILSIGKNIISTSSNFQKFEAVLTNALGDKSEAQRALRQLQDFAATTPFQLDELTNSYIKLVNRGIKPTQADLVALGDLAASQGKEFDQLTEALLDATTGEFERLKEFGIRAKKEGDTVALTFRGVTKEVNNNEEAIKAAILQFGQFEGVLGSTAAQAATRAGLISNLSDNISRLFTNLGSGYIGRVFDLALGGVNKLIGGIIKLTDTQTRASDSTRQLQAQFNAQIETLKRGNLSQENRAKIIDQINARYGEYLPNLLTEKSSIQDITTAQEAANKSFQKRILLLSAEESLQDTNRALLESTAKQLELEEQLTVQQQKLAAAREEDTRKNANRLNSSDLATNQVQSAITSLNAQIKQQADQRERLQKEFERTIEAANKFGVDIEKALSGDTAPAAGGGGGGGGAGAGGISLAEKALDTRLKAIEAATTREVLLLERALLQKEVTESEHGKRMLEIQQAQYQAQIAAYELYNESQTNAAEEARNKLIEVQQQLNRPTVQTVAPLATGGLPGQVERRGIDAGLDAAAQREADNLARLRRAFDAALLAENDYSIAKLELRRSTLEQEIELLRMGTAAEIQLAQEKGEQLTDVERQLSEERKRIAQEEGAAKQSIYEASFGFFQDSIDLGIQLLSKDEEARKKNIGIIKAFQKGQVVASGIAEVQKIWEKSAEFGPLGYILATVQTLAATVRTGTALAKINATKFTAKKGIAIGTFGGNLHSSGGTDGVFSDGTRINVERDEKFVVLNRRASGLLGALSTLNVATGGRPLVSGSPSLRYEGGGLVNTSPSFDPAILASNGAQDASELLNEFRMLRASFAAFPTQIRAYVPYTDIEDAANDVASVRSASSV